MNTVRQNRDLFLTVRTGWDLGSGIGFLHCPQIPELPMTDSVDYYQKNAKEYFEQTLNVKLEKIHNRFLAYIPLYGKILDAGCGSGRDARAFQRAGYVVKAFDASPALAQKAENILGQPVELLRFQEVVFQDEFDGIWACASLLHVPPDELPDVFRRLHSALKNKGVLYASFKDGSGTICRQGRQFTNMNEKYFSSLIDQLGCFSKLDHWVSRDCRPDRNNEFWFNILLQADK